MIKEINQIIAGYRKDIDFVFLDILDRDETLLVPWVLMAAYAEYIDKSPIISDKLFDKLCQKVYDNYDDINHPYLSTLDRHMFLVKSFPDTYPDRIKHGVEHLRKIYANSLS